MIINLPNGIVYTLTSDELYAAYEEQQHKFDRDYVADHLVEDYDNATFAEYFGVAHTEMLQEDLDELIDEIAREMRRQIDKYNLSTDYAFGESVLDVSNERKSVNV